MILQRFKMLIKTDKKEQTRKNPIIQHISGPIKHFCVTL